MLYARTTPTYHSYPTEVQTSLDIISLKTSYLEHQDIAMAQTKEEKAAYNRTYKETHKKEIAEKRLTYQEANKEKIAARAKAWREAHKEERVAHEKAYRESHKKEKAARQRADNEAAKKREREYHRAYCQNPEVKAKDAAAHRFSHWRKDLKKK